MDALDGSQQHSVRAFTCICSLPCYSCVCVYVYPFVVFILCMYVYVYVYNTAVAWEVHISFEDRRHILKTLGAWDSSSPQRSAKTPGRQQTHGTRRQRRHVGILLLRAHAGAAVTRKETVSQEKVPRATCQCQRALVVTGCSIKTWRQKRTWCQGSEGSQHMFSKCVFRRLSTCAPPRATALYSYIYIYVYNASTCMYDTLINVYL